MTNHPNRSRRKLAQYGARLRTIGGVKAVEMTDPDDRRMAYQYRRTPSGGIERRVVLDRSRVTRGWEPLSNAEIANLMAMRGEYHPILDPLGF